jgi:D-sedoheptulose 7-phosphate isomerase
MLQLIDSFIPRKEDKSNNPIKKRHGYMTTCRHDPFALAGVWSSRHFATYALNFRLQKPASTQNPCFSLNSSPANYFSSAAALLDSTVESQCRLLAETLDSARSYRKSVFLCGNGGSSANANHWANDLLYGANKTGLGGIRAHSLSANTAVITCLANDTGYENIFSTQLDVLASPGDVLIALSGSGNSANIISALEKANAIGLETWCVVGFDGGKALQVASHAIHFRIDNMQLAEDLQMMVCHVVTLALTHPRHA